MKEEIKELISMGENHLIEFKERVDKSLIEEICGFANSSGGKVILGVTDSGDIKGINTSNQIRSKIQNTIRQLKPSLNVTVSVEDNLVIIDVPSGEDKPYACSRGFFKRMGPNTQKLERDEILQIAEVEGRISFEKMVHKTATFEKDFDTEAFERFLELSHTTFSIDRKAILKNFKFLTDDERMTNLGVLFFAKDIEFLLGECVVRCLLFRGTENIEIIDDKIYKKGLIENVDNALDFIKRHTNVEVRVKGTTARSERIPDYPEEMLREGIVNAVSHRDYFDKSSELVISVFSNRVSISNPGGLISNIKPEDFGKKSITRNPLIATTLRYVNYAEKAGTGIKRMEDMAKHHKKKVHMEFRYDSFFELTFYKEMEKKGKLEEKTLRSVKKNSKILEKSEKYNNFNDLTKSRFRSIFGVNLEEFRSIFGVNALKTAWCIYKNPTITAMGISEKLSVNKRTIENYLSQLKAAGHIKRVGSDKSGYWETVKK